MYYSPCDSAIEQPDIIIINAIIITASFFFIVNYLQITIYKTAPVYQK